LLLLTLVVVSQVNTTDPTNHPKFLSKPENTKPPNPKTLIPRLLAGVSEDDDDTFETAHYEQAGE
jgi:hypothetical protein